MPRRSLVVALTALVALAPAAEAKHRKPIVKTFQVQNTVPYAAESAMCPSGSAGHDRHTESFRAPEAGRLEVQVTGFVGDFDIVVTDDKGGRLAEGNNETSTSGASPGTGSDVETLRYTVKRAMPLRILVCNYLASPNATGKYTFTYAR